MPDTSDEQGPTVWLLTDNKPGHRNQLRGLAERLEQRANARAVWVDVSQYPIGRLAALLGRPPAMDLPRPDIIVAAGTGTHRLLLACRRRFGALCVVLMRPSFPLRWVDLAVVPAHDAPPRRTNVLVTRGVLNAVTPRTDPVSEHQALVLLGGPSKHYEWQDEAILGQLDELCRRYPDWTWTITSSRRTPEPLIQHLAAIAGGNVHYHHHDNTPPEWLPTQLARARVAWVSPDSVSMVYEAITAGASTGLFELAATGDSRVVRGLQGLIQDGMVHPWPERDAVMAGRLPVSEPLWEADRAACRVLDALAAHRDTHRPLTKEQPKDHQP
ncbi:mitochondrial fission ELM1 family protein [Marinobacter sp. C2H3]|uniref:mitochondrial fission ELM1 family protein n=1 Tax=Marinobacter sp. C2H3 TaxID=3119003 RepID=UPI00300EEFC7